MHSERRLRSITWILFSVFITATQLSAAGPAVPVANSVSVSTQKDIALVITLTASDADNDPLIYTVVSGPTNGVLSGTAPNLTYTPNFHYSGSDSFTFKASDGTNDSTIATVSITVQGVRVVDYVAPTPGTQKTFKIAIVMLNTRTTPVADHPVTKVLEFYTPDKLGQIFFEHEHGAASFIKEASYGKIALEGRVVGWVDHPVAGLNGTAISSDPGFYLSLFNNYLTYSDYDVFVIHSLVEGSGQQSGWLYPQQSFDTPQGRILNKGITYMANSSVFDLAPLLTSSWSSGEAVLPTTSWSHELLHTFGISGHANSFNCGTAVIDPNSATNPVNGYGGVFSIMGEHCFGTHPDALMKSKIGWLTPAQIPTVTTTGTREIHPLAVNDGQTKALVIPVSPAITHSQNASEFDALVVEYRTATGFDRYLERLKGSPFLSSYTTLTNIDTNGVVVYMRYANTDTDATALLDMNPTTTFRADRGIKVSGNVGKFADAILPVNRTFTWNDIQITPLGASPSGAMRVSVTKSAAYVAWTKRTFASSFTNVVTEHDPDGDGVNNFLEFAFGTDPTLSDAGQSAGSSNGTGRPVPKTSDNGATYDLQFVRRDDHGVSGSLNYSVQFSSDLVTFYNSAVSPTWVADSTADGNYEVVKVPYPALLPNGKKATFGRIAITDAP